jgi:hypothetical protein
MSVRLIKKEVPPPGINVYDMKCGQLGEVVAWQGNGTPIGLVVQRVDNQLIVLGQHWGSSYGPISNFRDRNDLRVRLLQPGETITVTQNN